MLSSIVTGSPRKTSVPASAVCSPAGTLESSSQLLSTVHSGTLHSTIPCTPRITCRSATGARLESGAQPQQISPALLHCALSGYQSDSAEMQHLRSLEYVERITIPFNSFYISYKTILLIELFCNYK